MKEIVTFQIISCTFKKPGYLAHVYDTDIKSSPRSCFKPLK